MKDARKNVRYINFNDEMVGVYTGNIPLQFDIIVWLTHIVSKVGPIAS